MKKGKNTIVMDENMEKNHRNSKVVGGLIVIAAGVLILLNQMGFSFPPFLLSWKMILIAVGFVMLIKHNFQKTSAYVLIAIGTVFILNDFFPNIIETRFFWPILIIGIGISMIFKNGNLFDKKKPTSIESPEDLSEVNSEDYVKSASLFSGITKKVVSKNFKGATISSVFGGNEINLSQADFTGEAVIDITCVFGGVTLIVPSHWKVKSDLTSVFGGIDDQRPSMVLESISEDKVLVLKGACVFGGIEIHSYN
jgi:predicted membrane protein